MNSTYRSSGFSLSNLAITRRMSAVGLLAVRIFSGDPALEPQLKATTKPKP